MPTVASRFLQCGGRATDNQQLTTDASPSLHMLLDYVFPFILRVQDKLDHLSHRSMPAARRRHIMRDSLHISNCISHCYRHPCALEHTQIHHVIPYITDVLPLITREGEQLF